MQQSIKKLQWFEYLKVVFLEILNPPLCQVLQTRSHMVVVKAQCTYVYIPVAANMYNISK